MRLSIDNVAIANRLRAIVMHETELIDDGEAVAMVLLWSFLLDHADAHGLDVEDLCRCQLEEFITYARAHVVRQVH